MSEQTESLIIMAFISHLESIASMPGRNTKHNLLEATEELTSVCKQLRISEQEVRVHGKLLLDSFV